MTGWTVVVSGLAAALAVLALGETLRLPRRSRTRSRAARLARFAASRGLGGRLTPPRDLPARIAAAGTPGGLGVREWMAAKLACAAATGAAAALGAPAAPGRTGILLVLGAPLAAFVLPDLWLARAARARLDQAGLELADLVDLLRVTIEAGLPPFRALAAVASEFRGPLASELGALAALCELGEPREEALPRLVARLPCDELRWLARILNDSGRRGAPPARALALLAERARDRRRQEIRERAARAGPKIQLVVALLLVPSVLLMVAAVLAAELPRVGPAAGF